MRRSTEILARLRRRRVPESVAILDGFDDAAWARTGVHATYGVLDVAALLRLAIDHDAEHLASLASGD